MKSVFYSSVLVLIVAVLIGCPQPKAPTQPTTQVIAPAPDTAMPIGDNVSATLEQNSIAAIQTSSVKTVIDFNYRLTGSLTLRRIEATIVTNDRRAQGTVKLYLNGVVIWSKRIEHISQIIEGEKSQIIINTVELSPALMTAGLHSFRFEVESDHGVGDMLQGEIRQIVTDQTEHNVVFRWASVLCG